MKDKYAEILTDLEKHSPKTASIFAAIDLIKEQRTEIARLEKLLDSKCDMCIERERAKAIKDFAESLKSVASLGEFPWDDERVYLFQIDELEKELTERKEKENV